MNVTVYYITGRQLGPLTVPNSWCEDCDITVRLVRKVVGELAPNGGVRFTAKPWIRHMFEALRYGGWHAPVVLVQGEVFSQGVVPDETHLRKRLASLVSASPEASRV